MNASVMYCLQKLVLREENRERGKRTGIRTERGEETETEAPGKGHAAGNADGHGPENGSRAGHALSHEIAKRGTPIVWVDMDLILEVGIPTDRQCSARRGRSRQICRFLTCVYYISECIIWIKLMVLSSWAFLLSFHMHIISLDHVLNKREADKQGAYASPTARFVRVVGAVSWTPWHKTCYL